jgi:hypothetical protein
MLLAREFRDKAELCLQMADRAPDPLTKTAWQRLAIKWRELEREEVKQLEQSSSR